MYECGSDLVDPVEWGLDSDRGSGISDLVEPTKKVGSGEYNGRSGHRCVKGDDDDGSVGSDLTDRAERGLTASRP